MDEQPQHRAQHDIPEAVPTLVRPRAHVHSPMLASNPLRHRPADLDHDRATVALPSARALVMPVAFGLLAALPVTLVVDWQSGLVVGAAAAILRELDRRVAHVTFSFGDGFLPFRSDNGWPRGVQEDDDVHWNWSPGRLAGPIPPGRGAAG